VKTAGGARASRAREAAKRTSGEDAPARGARLPAAVLIVALLVPLLNMIPTWDGYRNSSPPGRVFLGFRNMAGDHYQYASFVRQAAAEGRFFMENRFTTEPQSGRFVLLYLWLVGSLSGLTGLSVPASWEVLRLVSGFTFLVAIWKLTALCFEGERSRMLAYLFVAFSGGIGWVMAPFQAAIPSMPGLPGVKDAFNFQWNWSSFDAMLVPLWVAPAALFVAGCFLLVRVPVTSAAVRWGAGLLLPPVIWYMHPYTGLAAYLAFGLYPMIPVLSAMLRVQSVPWDAVRERCAGAAPFLLSFAFVAPYLLWAREDAVFAAASRQGFMWSPAYSVFLYPLAYGVILPLALVGIRFSASIEERPRHMLAAWLTAAVALASNPFFAGVKFQYLVHAPLALYAAHGVIELRRRSPKAARLSRGAGAALFGALLFMNAPLTLFKDMPGTASDGDIYAPAPVIQAMRFLDEQPPGPVLCSYASGNLIPWLARKTVYQGHWFLTIDQRAKAQNVEAFFNGAVPLDDKRRFLSETGIRYVFFGPSERVSGSVDPALGLQTIYDQDGVTILRAP
jgi:hypothetical protein